jgi:hypothetical protein
MEGIGWLGRDAGNNKGGVGRNKIKGEGEKN